MDKYKELEKRFKKYMLHMHLFALGVIFIVPFIIAFVYMILMKTNFTLINVLMHMAFFWITLFIIDSILAFSGVYYKISSKIEKRYYLDEMKSIILKENESNPEINNIDDFKKAMTLLQDIFYTPHDSTYNRYISTEIYKNITEKVMKSKYKDFIYIYFHDKIADFFNNCLFFTLSKSSEEILEEMQDGKEFIKIMQNFKMSDKRKNTAFLRCVLMYIKSDEKEISYLNTLYGNK